MHDLSYITDVMKTSIADAVTLDIRGKVTTVRGTIIRAVAPCVDIGELCILHTPGQNDDIQAEVVGFDNGEVLLTPIGSMFGISHNTEVHATGTPHRVAVGPDLLGRVVDGMGRPADGGIPIKAQTYYPVYRDAPAPMKRQLIRRPLSLGLRSLDGILTCGEGQRMGIFAAAGGGKSTLLSMIIKGTEAEVTVLSLIGERGREVREFIERDLGPEGLRRSVIVVSTSDKSSMERSKSAFVATTIAEYFRDRGSKVLLLMDSVTRFARAQREIGLAAGEPPTRRGFPPSVFALLPRLMERTGMSEKGSITALYTVLVEGDDMTEPVADETRSILDGHIILSRKLAQSNHYPAIDILASASRVMGAITTPEHRELAGRVRSLLARYREIELLVRIGEYKKGSDRASDEAIDKIDAINRFLQQKIDETSTLEQTFAAMQQLFKGASSA